MSVEINDRITVMWTGSEGTVHSPTIERATVTALLSDNALVVFEVEDSAANYGRLPGQNARGDLWLADEGITWVRGWNLGEDGNAALRAAYNLSSVA